MYFERKRKENPDKIWVPGKSDSEFIGELLRKKGLNSFIKIKNMMDIDHYLEYPNIKYDVIYIDTVDRTDLIEITQKCYNVLSPKGYILIDRLFPYYEEFEFTGYREFVTLRQGSPYHQFNLIWDVSYGLGVITAGEDQYVGFFDKHGLDMEFDDYENNFCRCMNPISGETFLNSINPNSKYKYSIITAIFEGYEIVREVKAPQQDVEYVLVTDDPDLKSDTWKVVLVDEFFKDMSGYAKAEYVKYHPFEFIESNTFLWIDGSIQILDDCTSEIMVPFIESDYELLELVNSVNTIGDWELGRWLSRGFHDFDQKEYDAAKRLFNNEPWVDEMLVQTTIYGGKNTKIVNLINNRMWDALRTGPSEKRDVSVVCMPQRGKIVTKYTQGVHKCYYLDANTLFSKYFDYCYHKSHISQKESWHSVGNDLKNEVFGQEYNLIKPKQISE